MHQFRRNGAEAQIRTGDTRIFNCDAVRITNENNELISHKSYVRLNVFLRFGALECESMC